MSRWIDAVAMGASVGVHALLVLGLEHRPSVEPARVYAAVEMVPAPVPVEPPPPPPAPEAPAPPPKPKPVPFTEAVPDSPAAAVDAVVEVPQPPRVVQGLSASSFAPGSGTGLSVRAGTSLGTAAKGDRTSLDDAVAAPTYAEVTRRPKCGTPRLTVPESVSRDRVEGRVEVLFDVEETGRVRSVRVVGSLTADADAACVAAWSGVTCRPGETDGQPVRVTDMPHSCRFEALR